MTEQLLVHFTTTGPEADERLIRDYVLEAVDRLPELSSCDGVGFVPAGHKPIEGGLVLLQIVGDVDAVVENERDRWDALVEEGLAEDWSRGESDRDIVSHWGEKGAELRTRHDLLAARMSRLVFEEFDTPPDPVDSYPEEEDDRESPTGIGWWTLLHILTLQQGYPYGMEIDAYAEGIRDALHHIVLYEGPEPANVKIDEVIETLEEARVEVDQVADTDE
jgi:hypothetical protein